MIKVSIVRAVKEKPVQNIGKHIKCILAKTQKTKNTLKFAISIDLFANFWYSIWAGKKSGAKVPFLPQEKPMERWSSGLRHTLGKRARLTASAGSNPVLSAKQRLAMASLFQCSENRTMK